MSAECVNLIDLRTLYLFCLAAERFAYCLVPIVYLVLFILTCRELGFIIVTDIDQSVVKVTCVDIKGERKTDILDWDGVNE